MTMTRASNKTAKPGDLDKVYDRRPSSVVQAEKAAKEKEKKKREAARAQGRIQAAKSETASRQQALSRQRNVNAVNEQSIGIPKSTRKRPASAEPVEKEPKKIRYREIVTRVPISDDEGGDEEDEVEEDEAAARKTKRFELEMREAEEDAHSDSDEYDPAAQPGEEEDDEDDDDLEEMMLEVDEPDTALNQGKEKKKKAGVANRKRIRQMASQLRAGDIPESPSPAPTRPKPKPPILKGHDGFKATWEKDRSNALLRSPPSTHRRILAPTSDKDDDDDDDSQPQLYEGGLVDDDEDNELERTALQFEKMSKVESITSTSALETSSKYTTKSEAKAKAKSKKKARPLVNDLPPEGKRIWRKYKGVAINQLAGADPWTEHPETSTVTLWNSLVGKDSVARISANKEKGQKYKLFVFVRTLFRNQVLPSEWRYPLSQSAIEAVKDEWKLRELNTESERAEFSEDMLGLQPRNRSSTKRPFLWGSTNALDWKAGDPAKNKLEGLFKGRMVLKVLGAHYNVVCGVVKEEDLEQAPVGALCMAIQAVNRALEYSLEGFFDIPPSHDKTGYFSAENWGDYQTNVEIGGKDTLVDKRRATVFLSTIKTKLDAPKWKEITDAARVYATKKSSNKSAGASAAHRAPATRVWVDEDEILEDPVWVTSSDPGGPPTSVISTSPSTSSAAARSSDD